MLIDRPWPHCVCMHALPGLELTECFNSTWISKDCTFGYQMFIATPVHFVQIPDDQKIRDQRSRKWETGAEW